MSAPAVLGIALCSIVVLIFMLFLFVMKHERVSLRVRLLKAEVTLDLDHPAGSSPRPVKSIGSNDGAA